MAHLALFARGREVAARQLYGPLTIGRSLDCDLFLPDVFVSRRHCRFEEHEEGWHVVDLGSTNGVFFRGRRVHRRVLHDGDVLEIGTVAIVFRATDVPGNTNSGFPFGGGPLCELVDTVFATGLRPAAFLEVKARKSLWVAKITGSEGDLVTIEDEEEEVRRRLAQEEWTELDLEVQIREGSISLRPPQTDDEWTEVDIEVTVAKWPVPVAPTASGSPDSTQRGLAAAVADDAREGAGPIDGERAGDKGAIVRHGGATAAAWPGADGGGRPAGFQPRGGAWAHGGDGGTATETEVLTTAEARRRTSERRVPPPRPVGAAGAAARAAAIPSLWSRLAELVSRFSLRDFLTELRYNPRYWLAAAAIAIVLFVASEAVSLISKQLSKPPLRLPDGRPNPAYFDGDEPS